MFAVVIAMSMATSDRCHADGIRLLRRDSEALQARIDLIEQAAIEIDIVYYAVDTGEVPISLLELLRQAAHRGVKVRLLVDGLKSRLPSEFERYLRQSGMRIRVYHPPHEGNPRWLNYRLHTKLVIADSQQIIIGSRNLKNEHFGLAGDDNYIDCDAYLFGEIAGRAQQYFDWLWSSADVRRAPDRDSLGLDILNYRPGGRAAWSKAWRDARTPAQFQSLLNQSIAQVACRLGVQFNTGTDWSADTIGPITANLLYDCRTDKTAESIQKQIIRLINSARCSLLIESPFPAFSSEVRDAIIAASRRGVRVVMFTNSLKTADQLCVYAAYQNDKRRLLRSGITLREYDGCGHLHAKSMLIDNCAAMIGSYNFDSRSDHYNLELMVLVRDPTVSEALKQSIATRMRTSQKIDGDRLLLEAVGNDPLRRLRMMLQRTSVELYRRYL